MQINDKILITGGRGLVGTALQKVLNEHGYTNIIAPTSADLDLLDKDKTLKFFLQEKPDYVFHIAATVYGIMGNMNNQGWSFYSNTLINMNVVEATKEAKAKKIIAMGSGCVYPYPAKSMPLREDEIFYGLPHDSEEGYAQSKRAMLAQLKSYKQSYNLDYAFVISGNLFGPNDKFDIENGHVTPSLVRKFYEAKQSGEKVSIWGNGSAKRDFLHSEDMAEALIIIANKLTESVNVASGEVHSIKELVEAIAQEANMIDSLEWDSSKPNGQDYREYDLKKLFDTGFKPKVSFKDGAQLTYKWYVDNTKVARI